MSFVVGVVAAIWRAVVGHTAYHIDVHARADQVKVQARPVSQAPGVRVTERHNAHRRPASPVTALQTNRAVRIVASDLTVRQYAVVYGDLVDGAGKMVYPTRPDSAIRY
jgi:hypothetical protein